VRERVDVYVYDAFDGFGIMYWDLYGYLDTVDGFGLVWDWRGVLGSVC